MPHCLIYLPLLKHDFSQVHHQIHLLSLAVLHIVLVVGRDACAYLKLLGLVDILRRWGDTLGVGVLVLEGLPEVLNCMGILLADLVKLSKIVLRNSEQLVFQSLSANRSTSEHRIPSI